MSHGSGWQNLWHGFMPFFLAVAGMGFIVLGLAIVLHSVYPVSYVSVYYAALCLPLAYFLARRRRQMHAANPDDRYKLHIESIINILVIIPIAAVLFEIFPAWNFWIFALVLAAFFLPGAWRERKIVAWLNDRVDAP